MARDFGWWVSRLRKEYYCPSRAWTARLVNAFLDARALASRRFQRKIASPIAVYDLRICPNTFDFAYYLYRAEVYFNELGFDKFDVCILDKEEKDLGQYESIIDVQKRRKRVYDILVPMAEMYQGCRAVTVFSEPAELTEACKRSGLVFPRYADGRHLRTHVYDDIYRKMLSPQPFTGFAAPDWAIKKVGEFLVEQGVKGPFVTLTIRAYKYQPLRNTDMAVYFDLAEYLKFNGFTPVFIPDADAPKEVDLSGYIIYNDACFDLFLRAAIYQLSYWNVFTSNGVHAIAGFNRKCKFVLALVNEAYPESTGMKRWEAEGLKFGDQPFGGMTRHFIWAKEDHNNLKEHFGIMRSFLSSTEQTVRNEELGGLS